ncbi:hypothetical protein VE02_04911 [Pseudogymnoascus sp. 03VT05]|nr:hypothetical protein VE02_04911 [Pseudogymnoascus sp. 03VT05]
MAGKGKKGKSKGGNKPKAASQAPKQTPAVEAGAAAVATNSSTPIDSELITPGALDLKISDPEVAAVAGEEAGDKAAPETGAAAPAPAAKAVEKEEAPVPAAEKLQKEEPVVAETKKEGPIVAAAEKQKEAPIVAEKQRDAPIGAEKQQKEAPLPAAVGAQKDVSAPAAESKQTPTIGGASATPLAASIASTKRELLANNNPFIAAPTKETKLFESPVVAAPVKETPAPATKTEAFKDVPIQSKETAPAPKVQQPEAAVPTHATPPASTNPYTQPIKTTNEGVARVEQKIAADGFEAAPLAKPTPAAATEPYTAPPAVEDLKRAPVPSPSEFVTETTPYQPPAPAAAVPQQTTTAAPIPAQDTTTTTGTAGRPTPSPSPAAASSSKLARGAPDSDSAKPPKRTPSRKESEAKEFWPAMYTSSLRPAEEGGRVESKTKTKTQTQNLTEKTSSPATRAPALASPAHIPSPLPTSSTTPTPSPPVRSPSPRSHGPSTPPPALANAFPLGPPAQKSAPISAPDISDPGYLPAEDTVDGFINPWSRAARLSSVKSPAAAGAAGAADVGAVKSPAASTAAVKSPVSAVPENPFATPPAAPPTKPLPRAPTHPAEKPINTGPNREKNPFFPPRRAPSPSSTTDGDTSSTHSKIPRKPAPKKVPRLDGMEDVRLEELPVGAPGGGRGQGRGGIRAPGRFPSLEERAPWGMRVRNWARGRGRGRGRVVAWGVSGVVVVGLVVGLGVGLGRK